MEITGAAVSTDAYSVSPDTKWVDRISIFRGILFKMARYIGKIEAFGKGIKDWNVCCECLEQYYHL